MQKVFWCANKKQRRNINEISKNKDYTTDNLLDYEYFSKRFKKLK